MSEALSGRETRPAPPQDGAPGRPDAASAPARSRAETLTLLTLAVTGVLMFAAARWVQPDPRGLGTHQRLGLPPCGFQLLTGYPCPGCGLTTSFAWVARGEILHGLRVQPFGGVLAIVMFGMPVAVGLSFAGGRAVGPVIDRALGARWARGALAGILLFAMLAWGYKVVMVAWGIPTG